MYLVFDIGGSKTRISTSENLQTLSEPQIFDTPKNFEEGIEKIRQVATDLIGGNAVAKAAGGIAGPLDKDKTLLVNAPNLPDWVDKPLKEDLEKALGCSVWLENDAALAGLGEASFGVGKEYKIVAYITVSTGIGGARIVDGHIDDNAMGFEPGHQVIFLDGDIAYELEGLISGSALEKKYGLKAENISDVKIWDEVALKLAAGLNNIIVIWSPQVVILGGSLMKRISLDTVRISLKNILEIFPNCPDIRPAQFDSTGGLYGAIQILKSKP